MTQLEEGQLLAFEEGYQKAKQVCLALKIQNRDALDERWLALVDNMEWRIDSNMWFIPGGLEPELHSYYREGMRAAIDAGIEDCVGDMVSEAES